MMLKILRNGREVEGLPAGAVLAHGEVPVEVADAVASWREAVAALEGPSSALKEAEQVASAGTLQVRGERERYLQEIREKTREEADALRAAERRSTAAARALVDALQEHAAEIRRLSALLALQAHADAVDAALSLSAARSRFGAVGGRSFALRPGLDTEALRLKRSTNVQESALDDLDRVDALRIADAAGTRLGLVEVAGRGGVRLLTTARRAAALVGAGGNGWTVVEEVPA